MFPLQSAVNYKFKRRGEKTGTNHILRKTFLKKDNIASVPGDILQPFPIYQKRYSGFTLSFVDTLTHATVLGPNPSQLPRADAVAMQ